MGGKLHESCSINQQLVQKFKGNNLTSIHPICTQGSVYLALFCCARHEGFSNATKMRDTRSLARRLAGCSLYRYSLALQNDLSVVPKGLHSTWKMNRSKFQLATVHHTHENVDQTKTSIESDPDSNCRRSLYSGWGRAGRPDYNYNCYLGGGS